jgi:hypothetical protein
MSTPVLEIEGTWEEILARAAELAGHRVRVTVFPSEPEAGAESPLTPSNRRMLELLTEWGQTPLTDEERAILDSLEQNLREDPLRLREVESET